MNILVCVKRVPDVGARLEITADGKRLEIKNLGFTISPHEECAVEEAVQMIERLGGKATVLTVGLRDAEEQLREAMARGMDAGILVEADDSYDPSQTAAAIVQVVREKKEGGNEFDIILFGNESADSGNSQVGIRVAHALGLPCVTGAKWIETQDGRLSVRRETPSGIELYEVRMPAVVAVKEGLNLPRHPSLRGTMTAKKKPLERFKCQPIAAQMETVKLTLPRENSTGAEILGSGKDAIPKIVKLLEEAGAL